MASATRRSRLSLESTFLATTNTSVAFFFMRYWSHYKSNRHVVNVLLQIWPWISCGKDQSVLQPFCVSVSDLIWTISWSKKIMKVNLMGSNRIHSVLMKRLCIFLSIISGDNKTVYIYFFKVYLLVIGPWNKWERIKKNVKTRYQTELRIASKFQGGGGG